MNEQALIQRLEQLERTIDQVHADLKQFGLENENLRSQKRALIASVESLQDALRTVDTQKVSAKGGTQWLLH